VKRLGILIVVALFGAAIPVLAAEGQRGAAEASQKYDPAQGWWRSFLPGETKPKVRAPAAGERADQDATAEPAASKSKAATKKRRTQSTRRSKAKSTKAAKAAEPAPSHKQSSEEARWWNETGNPAVFAFAGCVAEYTSAATREGKEAPHAEFVTEAMVGPCKEPFDRMAGLILKRHGEKGFARVSKELIETTFIPSVRAAVKKTTAEVRQDEKRKTALGAEVQKAKDSMFACFLRETDRLAAESTAEARAVGEAVIAACKVEADQFFVKLDELYPDVSAGAFSTRQTALSHNYLPAIENRIVAVRAASVQAERQ